MASYIYVPQNPLQYYDSLQSMVSMPSLIHQPQIASYTPQNPSAHAGLQPLQLLLNTGREMTAGIKRGSEEMLHHQAQMLANGSVTLLSELSPDLEPNDAKKVRLEQSTDSNANQLPPPSKVIEIAGVPATAREADLVQIAVPFGKVTNVLIIRNKSKGFIEMADLTQAVTCVNYHQTVAAMIGRTQVFLQFSSSKELKVDKNPAAAAAISEANAAQLGGADPNDPKLVLHVIVDNLLYPVTIDVLKQIFSRYGLVLKIIIFNKNNQFQALIQYSDPISAQTAKVSLDGQNIYNNCCTLRIDFSKLPALNVKYNNEKSRDYTNPSLPAGEGAPNTSQSPVIDPSPSPVSIHSMPGSVSGYQFAPNVSLAQAQAAAVAAVSAGMPALPSAHTTAGYGSPITWNPSGGGNFMHPTLHQLTYPAVQLQQSLGALTGVTALPPALQHPQLPQMPGLPASMVPLGLSQAAAANQMAANLAAARMQAVMAQAGCVILVSNLDEEKATPDALFTLFGVYGDVIRVKILYNKKDNALLQYNEPTQAQLALTHLDKIKVWGKQIRVAPSKHPIVQMPTDLQADGAKLTKDYTNSPLHRYKKKGSKNYQNIYPPSATLHLSNIPPDVQGELLKTEFAKFGKVTAFKFFEKDHKMALIQMETVDDAVMALIGMHNFQLGETSHLRVSFSKSTINPPAVSPTSINPSIIPVNIPAALLASVGLDH